MYITGLGKSKYHSFGVTVTLQWPFLRREVLNLRYSSVHLWPTINRTGTARMESLSSVFAPFYVRPTIMMAVKRLVPTKGPPRDTWMQPDCQTRSFLSLSSHVQSYKVTSSEFQNLRKIISEGRVQISCKMRDISRECDYWYIYSRGRRIMWYWPNKTHICKSIS